jgi:O-antigen ligase/polysaccharide polymerase Wzy-like membrane protein
LSIVKNTVRKRQCADGDGLYIKGSKEMKLEPTIAAENPVTSITPSVQPSALPWADGTILVLLLLLALAAPFWTKAAVLLFRMALLVSVLKWLANHSFRLPPLPLTKPLLIYITLAALSTVASTEPILSWGRMRTALLFLLAILVATGVRRVRHVKWITSALLFSTLTVALYTCWQYADGVGVRIQLQAFPQELARAGVLPQDIIYEVNGKHVRSASQWQSAAQEAPASYPVQLLLGRGSPPQNIAVSLQAATLHSSGLMASGAVTRARPERAQGLFYSYIPFAELLMLVAATCWGMVLAAAHSSRAWAFCLFLVFASIFSALVSTETRAAVASLIVAGVITFWMVAPWKGRILSAILLVALMVAGSVWFHQARAGQGWFDPNDAGTDYRRLMWRDGLRLAIQHPLLGIGMDTATVQGAQLGLVAYRKYPYLRSHFHSTYVQIAVETGLPALLAWLWLMAAYIIFLIKVQSHLRNGYWFPRGLALGLLSSAIAFDLAGFVHYISGDAEVMIVFWLLAGLALSLPRVSLKETEINPQQQ